MSIPRLPELLLILVIVLVIFGAGKLPEVAGSLGKSIREFRKHSQSEEPGPQQVQEPKQAGPSEKS